MDEFEAGLACGLPHVVNFYWALPSFRVCASVTHLVNQLRS